MSFKQSRNEKHKQDLYLRLLEWYKIWKQNCTFTFLATPPENAAYVQTNNNINDNNSNNNSNNFLNNNEFLQYLDWKDAKKLQSIISLKIIMYKSSLSNKKIPVHIIITIISRGNHTTLSAIWN